MGPLVKAPAEEGAKYADLGGKRCGQINGCWSLHPKIGPRAKLPRGPTGENGAVDLEARVPTGIEGLSDGCARR